MLAYGKRPAQGTGTVPVVSAHFRNSLYSTEYGHDDVGVAALYVGKERDHFVDDDHLVEAADESVDALEHVHSCLPPTDNQLTDRKHSSYDGLMPSLAACHCYN